MMYLGDFAANSIIYIPFQTFDTSGASVTLTGLAVTDIEIYKAGSTTQRASDNGYTLLDTDGIDFDSITGVHGFSIDTSDNSDAGFWASGKDYWVVVSAVTVDSKTVNFVAALFSIENRSALRPTTAGRTLDVATTGEAGLDFNNILSSSLITLNSLTVTGATTFTGATTHTGNVVYSDGITVSAPSTGNRAGITITGNGSGPGIWSTGGSTSGEGLLLNGKGQGAGFYSIGGSNGEGIHALGAGDGEGFRIVGGNSAVAAINCVAAGNGDGILSTGSGSGDGIDAVKGSTGVDIRGAITGNVTGNLSGSVGSVTGLTASNLDTTVSSRLAPTTAGRTLDVSAGGEAGVDWANVGSPTTTVGLSGTTINISSNVKKNTALAAFEFVMTDSTTHAPKTGVTVTATRSLDGAAFGACANSAAEVASGVYKIDLAAADLNANTVTLRFTGASADDTLVTLITQP